MGQKEKILVAITTSKLMTPMESSMAIMILNGRTKSSQLRKMYRGSVGVLLAGLMNKSIIRRQKRGVYELNPQAVWGQKKVRLSEAQRQQGIELIKKLEESILRLKARVG